MWHVCNQTLIVLCCMKSFCVTCSSHDIDRACTVLCSNVTCSSPNTSCIVMWCERLSLTTWLPLDGVYIQGNVPLWVLLPLSACRFLVESLVICLWISVLSLPCFVVDSFSCWCPWLLVNLPIVPAVLWGLCECCWLPSADIPCCLCLTTKLFYPVLLESKVWC